MKQNKWSKILSTAVILISVAAVLVIVFTSQELDNAWGVLASLNPFWLLACIACYAVYVYAEGGGLCAFLRMEGYRVKWSTATHFSFAGIYYANITPSSTGGQPMQVYLMNQRGVPGGIATSALTARYFFNQLALVLMTVVLWVLNGEFALQQTGHVHGLIILGCVINFFTVPLVILVMLNRKMVEKFVCWVIRFLARHKLCKRPEEKIERGMKAVANFHESLFDLIHHPLHLLIQFVISVVEMTALMLVPVFVFYALGQSGTPWYQILTVAYMLFVSASYTPLPGASGAQEGGFLMYFRGIFADNVLPVALLVWRFVTYYLCLLVGAGDQVYSSLRKRRKPIDHQEKDETQTNKENA